MNRSTIKDPLWGEIKLLKWEKLLLNTQAFNRLHGVLQNSNGYRVYPNARHSRFMHSLGTMHVSTQIASGLFRNHFSLTGDLHPIEDRFICANCTQKLLEECLAITDLVKEQLTRDSNLEESDLASRFSIHPQLTIPLFVVRIAALLHDIGHLPYSHVFEHAFHSWIDNCNPGTHGNLFSTPHFHEEIGHWIMLYFHSFDSHTRGHKTLRAILWAAAQLLHSKNSIRHSEKLVYIPKYPILKSIISGVIDSDRIDYIRRDGELSGFMKSGVDYQRLFRNFVVMKSESSIIPGEYEYFVSPSSKAKSDFEKLLWERYQEYTYVIGHHRVMLFDEITARLIRELLKRGKLNELLDGISRLKELTKAAVDGDNSERPLTQTDSEYVIHVSKILSLHCDDSFLDNRIRDLFIETTSQLQPASSFEDAHLHKLLTAYCEKRDLFASAYKIDEDFWRQWCKAFGVSDVNSLSKAVTPASTHGSIGDLIKEGAEVVEKLIFEDPETTECHIILAKSQAHFGVGVNSTEIAAYELGGLSSFLASKRDAMRPFNIWYLNQHQVDQSKRSAFLRGASSLLKMTPRPSTSSPTCV